MKRNYGIDLLRLAAMGLVIVLHIVGVGGVCGDTELFSVNFLAGQFLRTAAFCAVNVYALISGFVGWDRRPKLSGLLKLWLKVLVFCVVITVFFWLRDPETVGLKDLLRALTPVRTNQYWYFTAYVGLFFFTPFLNQAIRHISGQQALFALGGIAVLLATLPVSDHRLILLLADGYSTLWLMILYLVGGLMGRFEVHKKLPPGRWGLVYLLGILASLLPRLALLGLKPEYWSPDTQNLMVQYTSPTIILCACALVCLFAGLELKGSVVRIVAKLSPHAFGVYLLHTHVLIFQTAITGRFAWLASEPVYGLLGGVLGSVLVIFAAGIVLDMAITAAIRLTGVEKLLKLPDKILK